MDKHLKSWIKQCIKAGAPCPSIDMRMWEYSVEHTLFDWALINATHLAEAFIDNPLLSFSGLKIEKKESTFLQNPLISIYTHQPHLLERALQKIGPDRPEVLFDVFFKILTLCDEVENANNIQEHIKWINCAHAFIKAGVNWDQKYQGGQTVLLNAINHGKPLSVVRQLIKLGADPHACSETDASALFQARTNPETCAYLLGLGLDPKLPHPDDSGMTALMTACRWGDFDIIRMLWPVSDLKASTKGGSTAHSILHARDPKFYEELMSEMSKKNLVQSVDMIQAQSVKPSKKI